MVKISYITDEVVVQKTFAPDFKFILYSDVKARALIDRSEKFLNFVNSTLSKKSVNEAFSELVKRAKEFQAVLDAELPEEIRPDAILQEPPTSSHYQIRLEQKLVNTIVRLVASVLDMSSNGARLSDASKMQVLRALKGVRGLEIGSATNEFFRIGDIVGSIKPNPALVGTKEAIQLSRVYFKTPIKSDYITETIESCCQTANDGQGASESLQSLLESMGVRSETVFSLLTMEQRAALLPYLNKETKARMNNSCYVARPIHDGELAQVLANELLIGLTRFIVPEGDWSQYEHRLSFSASELYLNTRYKEVENANQ